MNHEEVLLSLIGLILYCVEVNIPFTYFVVNIYFNFFNVSFLAQRWGGCGAASGGAVVMPIIYFVYCAVPIIIMGCCDIPILIILSTIF